MSKYKALRLRAMEHTIYESILQTYIKIVDFYVNLGFENTLQ